MMPLHRYSTPSPVMIRKQCNKIYHHLDEENHGLLNGKKMPAKYASEFILPPQMVNIDTGCSFYSRYPKRKALLAADGAEWNDSDSRYVYTHGTRHWRRRGWRWRSRIRPQVNLFPFSMSLDLGPGV